MSPHIIEERCSGCGRCVAACRQKVITLETAGFRKTASLRHSELCTSCGNCVEECPLHAIEMRDSRQAGTN